MVLIANFEVLGVIDNDCTNENVNEKNGNEIEEVEFDVVDQLLLENFGQGNTVWDYARYFMKAGGCLVLAMIMTYYSAQLKQNNYMIK